jgi:polysaccharide deacetylase family protein (PEP-CTERM system associated)
MTPDEFHEDLRHGVDVLQQLTGERVAGFRAPTFSLMPGTAWAVDIRAESGLVYDSSVFPVVHDRYGIPEAPRSPFVARGQARSILELPLTTWRLGGQNLPVAGGGYFRLFPLAVLLAALRQAARVREQPAAVLYFHPWEFDPDQPRLPLRAEADRLLADVATSLRRMEGLRDEAWERLDRLDAQIGRLRLPAPGPEGPADPG